MRDARRARSSISPDRAPGDTGPWVVDRFSCSTCGDPAVEREYAMQGSSLTHEKPLLASHQHVVTR